MNATEGNSQTLLLRTDGVRWPDSALIVASILFALAIGVFLVARRVVGALTAPLPPAQLIATAAGLYVWAVGIQWFAAKRSVVFWMAVGTVLLFAIGCSYQANRLVDWLVWLPTIGLILWLPLAERIKKIRSRRPTLRNLPAENGGETAGKILQQLTRIRSAEGKDTMHGTLVAEFAPGERQITLYAGFCPPFELLPRVEANVANDSEADVKLAQVLHNGAQIDVRLSEPAEEPVAVTIEFVAVQSE